MDRGRQEQQAAKPGLHRSMGALGALFITLSGLSPSIGVFVVASDVIHAAGTAAVLCFAAAGVLGLAIGGVYAELASAWPETGGEYTIVGRILGPSAGFAMLGLNLYTFSIGPAITALGVVGYLQVLAPGLPTIPAAMALVLLSMALGVLNVRLNALITGLFLAVELASLATVGWLGFTHPARNALATALHPVMLAGGHLAPLSMAGLGVGAAAAIYAFDGYGSVVYFGEEMHAAPRLMAKVVFRALIVGALFMLVPLLAVIAGAADLTALMAAESPVPDVVRQLGGETVHKVMSLGVALALFNAMLAISLMGGRQLYSSARDQAWPRRVSAAVARLHGRFNSPWVATTALGATGILWCLVPLNVLLVVIGEGTAAIYACMCVAAIKGRGGAAAHAAWRMPLFPLAPWLALLALVAVAAADLFDADARKGLLATAATVIGAVAYYRLALHGRGRWSHKGPAREAV
ncbi:MAG TPA: APC family permease [Caulobacteraceae bacterium]|jgi:amino acid transporter